MTKQCPRCGNENWQRNMWTEVCTNTRCGFILPYNLCDIVDIESEEVVEDNNSRGIELINEALDEQLRILDR